MITTQFTVWCDTCVEWEMFSVPTKRSAEIEAVSIGWRKEKGKHICPKCRKKLQKKIT